MRRSIEVFWIQRNASGSVSPSPVCSRPLARSTALRVSSRSVRSATSASSADDLGEPGAGDLDRRDQVGLAERLDHVGHRARLAGPLDQLALAERGQHDDRGDAARSAICSAALIPSSLGILTSITTRSGRSSRGQRDGRLAVAGLADDVVALFGQHLDQVEPDQRLVLGDDHAGRACGLAGLGFICRHALTLASSCYGQQSSPPLALPGHGVGDAPSRRVECRGGESNPHVLADKRF